MSKIDTTAPKRKDLCQCGARGWVYFMGKTTFYRCGKCGAEWPRVLATRTNKLKARIAALEALALELAEALQVFVNDPQPTEAWLKLTNLDHRMFNGARAALSSPTLAELRAKEAGR